jgi:hypothetical protein
VVDWHQRNEDLSGYGETKEKQLGTATISLLKQRDGDAQVSKAETGSTRSSPSSTVSGILF